MEDKSNMDDGESVVLRYKDRLNVDTIQEHASNVKLVELDEYMRLVICRAVYD